MNEKIKFCFEYFTILFAICAWFLHLVFILNAAVSKGKIILYYNFFNEMTLEIVVISGFFILTLITFIIKLNEIRVNK